LKLEVGEGAPGEVEVTEGTPREVRARGPATSSEIEVGEGAPVAEPERTARTGTTNHRPRQVVRACAWGGKVRALGQRGIHGGGGDAARAHGRAGGAQTLALDEVVRARAWVDEVRGQGLRPSGGRPAGHASSRKP